LDRHRHLSFDGQGRYLITMVPIDSNAPLSLGGPSFHEAQERYWRQLYERFNSPFGQQQQMFEFDSLNREVTTKASAFVADNAPRMPEDGVAEGLDVAFPNALQRQPSAPESVSGLPFIGSNDLLSRLGLGDAEKLWPPSQASRLQVFAEEAEAIERLWASHADLNRSMDGTGEVGRIRSRRDEAIRFISARFYVEFRAAGIPNAVIDAVAVSFARRLEQSLCETSESIITVQAGSRLNSVKHETPASGGQLAGVTPLTFGLVRSGSVVMRVRVDPFGGPTGVPQ